jgi:hypothetical protein
MGVWSEGIELRAGEPPLAGPVRGVGADKRKGKKEEKGREKKGKGKENGKAKEEAKQTRITRAWPLPSGALEAELKLVEQTSFDLDKVSFSRLAEADSRKCGTRGWRSRRGSSAGCSRPIRTRRRVECSPASRGRGHWSLAAGPGSSASRSPSSTPRPRCRPQTSVSLQFSGSS